MSLLDVLTEEMKRALKAHDKVTLSTVRLLISQLKNERIDSGKELTPDDEIGVLMSAAKKRKESIEAYQAGNRQDLLEREQQELDIIQKYLPRQMSDDEVEKAIDEIMKSTGATNVNDLGKVMSEAMKVLKGRADGKKVQNIVRSKLA
jgi:uncharacterized protein YqeY